MYNLSVAGNRCCSGNPPACSVKLEQGGRFLTNSFVPLLWRDLSALSTTTKLLLPWSGRSKMLNRDVFASTSGFSGDIAQVFGAASLKD